MHRAGWAALLAAVFCGARAECADELRLEPKRDTRVFGHVDEMDMNGGQCTRLRTRGVDTESAEMSLMDFDKEAIANFLKNKRGKVIKAELVLVVREVQGAEKVKVEAAALVAAVDWKEGDKNQKPAEKGEATYAEAQKGVAPWTTVQGKKAADLKDLVLGIGKPTTVFNASTIEVTPKMSETAVKLPVDGKVLTYLGLSEACRGLVLFHRQGKATADFYSREQTQHKPQLVITAQ